SSRMPHLQRRRRVDRTPVYHGGRCQKNTRFMPGNFQPLVRIIVPCCPIVLGTQTEWAGTIGRRVQHQRSHRNVWRQGAFPTASCNMALCKEPECGDTSFADLPVPERTEHSDWVLCRAHCVWNLLLWGRDT